MIFFKKDVAMDIVNECRMFLKLNIKLKYINVFWSIKIVIIVRFDQKTNLNYIYIPRGIQQNYCL